MSRNIHQITTRGARPCAQRQPLHWLRIGCASVFTGLRVTKSDGSRFRLVGIQPTIPVSRTIAGVRAGRDEVLEKALAYVRTGTK